VQLHEFRNLRLWTPNDAALTDYLLEGSQRIAMKSWRNTGSRASLHRPAAAAGVNHGY
jgi:hypothetical protein